MTFSTPPITGTSPGNLPGLTSPCGCGAGLINIPARIHQQARLSLPLLEDALNSAQSAATIPWDGQAAQAYRSKLTRLQARLQDLRGEVVDLSARACLVGPGQVGS